MPTTLLSLPDSALTHVGRFLRAALPITNKSGVPQQRLLSINSRLRSLWRPLWFASLRVAFDQPADQPSRLWWFHDGVGIHQLVTEAEVVFALAGFERNVAAINLLRNLRSLSVRFHRVGGDQREAHLPPENALAYMQKLLGQLPRLQVLTCANPGSLSTDFSVVLPKVQTPPLRTLNLDISDQEQQLTSLPPVKKLVLRLGGTLSDMPSRIPFAGLESLHVLSYEMRLDAQQHLVSLFRLPTAPHILKHVALTTSCYDSATQTYSQTAADFTALLNSLSIFKLDSLELRMHALHGHALGTTSQPSVTKLTLDLEVDVFDTPFFSVLLPWYLRKIFLGLTRFDLSSPDTRCESAAEASRRWRLSAFDCACQFRGVSDLLALVSETKILDFRTWKSSSGETCVRWIKADVGEEFACNVVHVESIEL